MTNETTGRFPEAGETELLSKRANRKQGARAVGGRLALTNHRLSFGPHGFDEALEGDAFMVPLSSVRSADKSPVNLGDLFAGGLRRRLRIVLEDGSTELFVVTDVDRVAEAINHAINDPATLKWQP